MSKKLNKTALRALFVAIYPFLVVYIALLSLFSVILGGLSVILYPFVWIFMGKSVSITQKTIVYVVYTRPTDKLVRWVETYWARAVAE